MQEYTKNIIEYPKEIYIQPGNDEEVEKLIKIIKTEF